MNVARAATILLLIGALLPLAGCKSGLTIGPWTLIQSSLLLDVDRIEVARTLSGDAQPTEHDPIVSGLLRVDLKSGRASLTDSCGQAHPMQLHAKLTDRLRRGISDRSWMVSRGRLRPQKGATGLRDYEMTVYVDGEPLKRICAWHLPARHALPGTLDTVIEIFDQAVRRVYPLSNTVNLIE